ncbi:MAG: sigma-54 dependent transcriptional regulator [Holosporales bacterium]|nr:sigma-54 dependent transcriptional regulator [Holosporales bacterium]
MTYSILVVDDESDIRDLVSGILNDNEYETTTAGSYVEALENIGKKRPNMVILDVWLGVGDRDGIRLLEFLRKEYSDVPVIMMSGHASIETAVVAIKKGANDFIEKPFDSRRLITSVEKAIETSKLQAENADLKLKAKVSDGVLGRSQNVLAIRQAIEKIAPLGGRCVIIGPLGSDKEVIAREIHRLSQRAKGPFNVLNCRSRSLKQLEIEMFGIEIVDGGSVSIRQGLLEKTNGGTLFIDELMFAPQEFQNKILKMLKEDVFSRIGSHEKIGVTLRVIAGLPSNVQQLVKVGSFSDELHCRLSANTIKILPLKSRREDIPYLLDYYMDQASKAHYAIPKKFSSEAINLLSAYHWPGDVMQLRNMVEWLITVSISDDDSTRIVEIGDLPQEIIDGKKAVNYNTQFISTVSELSIRAAREAFEKEYFSEQLRKFSGNISQTAKFVGMERSALHRKLKSLEIVDSKSFKYEDSE